MLGKKAKARQANAKRADNMEWEAMREDRCAKQKLLWAQSETREGRPDHGRIFANQAQVNVQKADRLRREAAELRKK